MGKNRKRSKSKSPKKTRAEEETKVAAATPERKENEKKKTESKKSPKIEEKNKVTMDALKAMSDSDDSSGLPPEEEWDKEAKKLKSVIESGVFDGMMKGKKLDDDSDDDQSVEEVSLDDNDEEPQKPERKSQGKTPVESKTEESDESEKDDKQENVADDDEQDDDDDESTKELDDDEANETSDEENEGKDDGSVQKPLDMDNLSIPQLNAMRRKSLKATADGILNAQHEMGFPETFQITSKTPLPFGEPSATENGDPEDDEDDGVVDIHDDLKREVAFYNMALEAAVEARKKCAAAKIPFSRPENFFAEMVKTDDHMAKVKDRLIFENKKMEAVAQRKANKEQKLRARESHANKLAEKARRKKDNLREIDDYARNAASQRGGRLADDGPSFEPNKKRIAANKKWGFGGKTGRFKKTDPKSLNDMSGFNPRGNFAAGQKRTAGSGGNKRPGKRARDAARSRR